MQLITSSILKSFSLKQKRKMEELFPELIKRLIINSCPNRDYLRIPSGDDIWAPGFDGIVSVDSRSTFVNEGQSVWEFGTSSDSLKKINSDYKKRTENLQGIIPEETSFYLVIPKEWKYSESIPEWVSSHRDCWKSVRVYDAPVVCDWLNSEPAVCAWFLEQFSEKHADGFSTVQAAWNHFSNMTSPALSSTLFTIGRSEIIELFCNRLEQKSCPVRADTFYDACGFCLCALLQDVDLANTAIVVSDEETYHTLSKIVQGKVFLLLFPYLDQVSDSNHTILCCSREAAQGQSVLQLPSLWKTQFIEGIREMGLTDSQPSEMYTFTHGNLLALVRRIPGNIADRTPKWASVPGTELLYPLIFLKTINFSDENVRRVISMLVDDDVLVIQQQYDAFCRMEDAPLKRIDGIFVVTNYEEAWLTLNIDIIDLASQRLNEAILVLLSEYKDGTIRERSSFDGIIGNLIFNYIYYSQTGSDEALVRSQIKKILAYFYNQNCQTVLLDALPNLAEAAPTEVVAFLESLLLPEQLPLLDRLRSSHKSHSIIWALDRLVCAPASAIRACRLLIQFSYSKEFDSFGVSSRELLLSTLWLQGDHTPILPKEKSTIVEKMLRDNPSFGIPFAMELLDKRSIVRGVRIGAKDYSYPATPEERWRAFTTIASVTLKAVISQRELKGIEQLLWHYHYFPVADLTAAVLEFQPKCYSTNELLPLLFHLHEQVYDIQKFDLTERIPWIESLQAWIFRISADDPILQVAWMFFEYYKTPFQDVLEIEEEDYYSRKKKAREIRSTTFSDLKARFGINASLALIQYMEDHHDWGEFLASNLTDYEVESASKAITELGKYRILAGLMDSAPLSSAKTVFDSLSPELQERIVSSLSRSDILDWLITPDLERSYWKYKDLRNYDEQTYRSLLHYNPSGILFFLHQKQKNHPGIDEMLLEVLSAIITDGRVRDESLLNSLIRRVDSNSYSDEWATLCIQLVKIDVLKLSHHGYYPECLKTYFFRYPVRIGDIYSTDPELFSKLFSYVYHLPDEAFHDYHLFRVWSDTIFDLSQENYKISSLLADAFAKSPSGNDGIFPHEFVRIALEDYSDSTLTNDVARSKIYLQGARFVTDGLHEKQLADQFQRNAIEMELRYPQTAEILRYIANSYAAESKSDRRYAEIDHFG